MTALMIKKNAVLEVVDCELDQCGPIAAVDILWRNELIRTVSIYAPNQCAERKLFLNSFPCSLDVPCTAVLCEDFNSVTGKEDCTYQNYRKDNCAECLRRGLRDFDVCDVTLRASSQSAAFTH